MLLRFRYQRTSSLEDTEDNNQKQDKGTNPIRIIVKMFCHITILRIIIIRLHFICIGHYRLTKQIV